MATKKDGNKKAEKIKADLDEAMPMGFSASMHGNPLSRESALNRLAADMSKTGAADGMQRTASDSSFVSTNVPSVARTPMLYVDPMFDPILFLFPKDRVDEINKRLRHYYETDPIVGNAIDLHSTLPLSDFYLECEDPAIERYWNDFKDRSGLLEFLRCLVHDYFLLGEGIGLPIWDPINFEFSHFNQYPPENVDIFRTYVTPTAFFNLKPDPKLAEKVQSGANVDKTLLNMMDQEYVKSLQEGRPYLLGSDKKVMYLARQTTKYRNRGISILSRCLKDLLYKDKLRLLQLTFVDRHMFPIKIFKLGSESRGWIPNRRHFARLQQLLSQASNDPDFNILYHFGLQVDYVGTKDKIWNLIPEFEWVERQVMAALFVNEEVIHGGIPSAVRDTVNLRTLMHRYMDIREKIERIMITHIFLPIAQARGFYRKAAKDQLTRQANMGTTMVKVGGKDVEVPVEWIDKEKGQYRIANSLHAGLDISAYDIPRPVWKKMNLINNMSEQQLLINLEAEGKIPLEMVLDILGIDPRLVKSKLWNQYSTPLDPTWRQIRDEVGKDQNIRLQVLQGKKPDQWRLEEGKTLDVPAPAGAKTTKPAPGATPSPAGKPAPKKPGDEKKEQPGGGTPPSKPAPKAPAPVPAPETAPAPPIGPTGPEAA
jgi:hypothetical protein